jgi:hypothetical protein
MLNDYFELRCRKHVLPIGTRGTALPKLYRYMPPHPTEKEHCRCSFSQQGKQSNRDLAGSKYQTFGCPVPKFLRELGYYLVALAEIPKATVRRTEF